MRISINKDYSYFLFGNICLYKCVLVSLFVSQSPPITYESLYRYVIIVTIVLYCIMISRLGYHMFKNRMFIWVEYKLSKEAKLLIIDIKIYLPMPLSFNDDSAILHYSVWSGRIIIVVIIKPFWPRDQFTYKNKWLSLTTLIPSEEVIPYKPHPHDLPPGSRIKLVWIQMFTNTTNT